MYFPQWTITVSLKWKVLKNWAARTSEQNTEKKKDRVKEKQNSSEEQETIRLRKRRKKIMKKQRNWKWEKEEANKKKDWVWAVLMSYCWTQISKVMDEVSESRV